MIRSKWKLQAEEGEGGGGGGGAAPAPAPAAPAPSPAPAPAGAPAAPAPAPAADGPSALSGGQDWKPESIPDKFRVTGDDGQIDMAATLRKVDEHRSNLEKRMGAGDIRPKTADEYKLPDNDTFKGLALDDAATAVFRKDAHEMGLSQKQYEGIMTKWATLAPGLVEAGQQETAAAATATLQELYGDEFKPNMQAAWRAGEALAAKIGISPQELDKALGNSPVAIRMLVALSKEMGEDQTPAAANGAVASGAAGPDAYESFMAQGDNMKAYSDSANPRHKEVTAQARRIIEGMTKKP